LRIGSSRRLEAVLLYCTLRLSDARTRPLHGLQRVRDGGCRRDLLAADVVERAVQLEEFADDVAVSNPVPARGGVRDRLDEFDLDQEVSVVADGLAGDARVVCA
jgi:hypothetical protein